MRTRILITIISVTCIFLFISVIDSFNHNYSNNPKDVDVIIVVGGADGRMQKGAELYKDEYSKYVLITPIVPSINFQNIDFAVNLGIPESAIIEEYEATSTYSNATRSFTIMKEYGFKSALIVTSDYHLKRTKMIYDRENNLDYDLTYISAYNANGEQWYERYNAKKLWFSEYYKLWAYRVGLYKFIDL